MSAGFVVPVGPAPAKIMIVGEFPGEREANCGIPFVGSAGQELDRMLKEVGIFRSTCFVTNVIRYRPPGNDITNFIAEKKSQRTPQHVEVLGKWCLPLVRDGVTLLQREIELVQPNVIIAVGNVALWALTGQTGIMSWRGSLCECNLPLALPYKPKVIPTIHPSILFRQWSWRGIALNDLRRVAKESQTRELIRPDYKFIIRPSYGTALAVLHSLRQRVASSPLKLAVDIETRAGHTACVGLAWSKTEAMCIPWMCVEQEDGYWTLEEETELRWQLMQLLTHPNAQVIGQNFLYDAQYFHRHDLYIPNVLRDTMLAQHVCFCNMQKSLAFQASMYCEHYEFWKDEGKEWSKDLDEGQLWTYNCKDCTYTYEVDEVEQRNVDLMGLRDVHDFQQSLFYPVLNTMNRGLRVDMERRSRFALSLFDEIAKREQWLIDVIGHPLNIKSSDQMKEFFYGALNQKPIFNRKSGAVSCDDEALRKIAEREPMLLPITRKIAELRSLGVFLSTFVNAPVDIDGRMRCSFNIAGTETFRFSSSKNAFGSGLNLQNIPKGGEGEELDLPNVRSLFIPDPGNTFFDIDLASADLRIVVWEADEPEMKAMLREGLDPYTEIAKEFYHDPSITKKDPRRQTFKSFAHGTNYLGTAKGLAERLGLGVHEAEQTQKWYFGRFKKIKQWQDDLKDQVIKRRMIQNVFGYRCYIFERIEGTIFNECAAWIPQSTVACLINRAYVKIAQTLPHVEVLLQVHDSLAGQFPSHLGDACVRQIIDAAEIPLPYAGDPLVIPVGCKTSDASWGDCG